MIKVKIFKDDKDYINRYTISGHSGYDIKGNDIVCAAVSVLAQTVLFSLVEVCGVKEEEVYYFVEEEKGILDVCLPKAIDKSIKDRTQIVLKTLELGIKAIVENYPEYVILEYGEV